MSTTTDAPVATPAAAAKPARKRTPAKKAPAKAPAKKAAPAEKAAEKKVFIASAEGRGGETNTRKVPFEATHGVDVADDSAKKAALQKGQIWRFFPSKEAAEKWCEKMRSSGYDAIVVPAKSKAAK